MSIRDELAEALARTQYEARKDATFNYIALVSPTWDEMWDTHRTKWTQQAEPMADAILPIIEREVEKARAESEAKARRFANLLGNQAKYLNDVLPAEALRQKADAWDEGCTAWQAYLDGRTDNVPPLNPYRPEPTAGDTTGAPVTLAAPDAINPPPDPSAAVTEPHSPERTNR